MYIAGYVNCFLEFIIENKSINMRRNSILCFTEKFNYLEFKVMDFENYVVNV